tara:strand:+ start:1086 stop:1412 length:327 start_codon:yes stop_codon:yes gene_type:complete
MNLKPLIKEGKFESLIKLIELSKHSYPSNPLKTFKELIKNNSSYELDLILESLKIILDKNFIIEGKGKISNKQVVEEFIEEYERMERLYDFNYEEYLKEVERTGIDLN